MVGRQERDSESDFEKLFDLPRRLRADHRKVRFLQPCPTCRVSQSFVTRLRRRLSDAGHQMHPRKVAWSDPPLIV
jgi:hypothetical protein